VNFKHLFICVEKKNEELEINGKTNDYIRHNDRKLNEIQQKERFLLQKQTNFKKILENLQKTLYKWKNV